MKTYSAGMTPPDVIKEAFTKPYPMSLTGEDAQAVVKAVNQGIDSHLEAISNRSLFEWSTRAIGTRGGTAALDCVVHPEEMPVLLRRLLEMEDEAAESLRSAILSSMDIEEV